ncbi:hypothetical protein QEH42_gp155 [Microbacterium phage Pumpernickel]|uniref:Uncharacterized protein n=1 Tax=Microbacterium phage Pumpernickel TaxID=2885983 RepID=A0AAE8Y7C2_9CAUD|nr:hypothetical protein QEH42_gp012 [Microbacterium phage Pumpernickel]YP_010755303.1 hypothetical protein QEH42_gp155 [Microbacterium phage Pumpernickel]UDL15803.1 hypothetical protein SEA_PUMPERNICKEL_12 [Microbacterium phage Pumpernickel]UDL16063.1 hypothetical protein SEA_PUMPERNICKEL_313 [Microbacterium phage Pumpernickel]
MSAPTETLRRYVEAVIHDQEPEAPTIFYSEDGSEALILGYGEGFRDGYRIVKMDDEYVVLNGAYEEDEDEVWMTHEELDEAVEACYG